MNIEELKEWLQKNADLYRHGAEAARNKGWLPSASYLQGKADAYQVIATHLETEK